jgi:hypothetical protein
VHAIVPPLSLCGPVLNVWKFSSIPLARVGRYQKPNHGVPQYSVPCWADWAHSVPIPDGNTASDLLRSRLAEVHVLVLVIPSAPVNMVEAAVLHVRGDQIASETPPPMNIVCPISFRRARDVRNPLDLRHHRASGSSTWVLG